MAFRAEATQLYSGYKYPWAANDADWRVTQTWHGGSGSFSYKGNSYSWGDGYALDFQAVSNIGSGGVNILAPADAEIAFICRDENNQAAISLVTLVNGELTTESLGIVHLEADSIILNIGDRVDQGDFLGKLHSDGSDVNAGCGYGASNHLHVRFPVRYPSFAIDGDIYSGNDNSFLYKEVESSNGTSSTGGGSGEGSVSKLSSYDQLTGTECISPSCSLIGSNINDLYYDNSNLFPMLVGLYGLEAYPATVNNLGIIEPVETKGFNLREYPASESIGYLPWGTQGKLLKMEPVLASLGGTEYSWWNVDLFGYGSGWMAGDFLYQRFHSYGIYVTQDPPFISSNDPDDGDYSMEPNLESVPEPRGVFMLTPFLILFLTRYAKPSRSNPRRLA